MEGPWLPVYLVKMTQNPTTTIFAGEDVEVFFRDEPTRQPEDVFVRQLPIIHLRKFAKELDSEAGMVRLATEKDDDFLASLTDNSFLALLEKAVELNFTRTAAMLERAQKRTAMLPPGILQAAQDQALRSSAPKQP